MISATGTVINASVKSLYKPHTLVTRAKQLQKQTGLPLDKKISVQDLSKFESILSVKILIVDVERGNDSSLLLQLQQMTSQIEISAA